MKQPLFTTVLAHLLVALAATVCTATVSANAASDCRQEAMDYEISAEQLDDYINGCLASRGELISEDATDIDMEYVPPDEPVDEEELLQESLTDDGDVTY